MPFSFLEGYKRKRRICSSHLQAQLLLRKLAVGGWLISFVQLIRSNPQCQVRANGCLSDDSQIQIVICQGSFLRPLLFIILLKAFSKHCF